MDFRVVLKNLLNAFNEQNIRYAVIGGFAMGLLGSGKTTIDLDFLVNREDMEKVDDIMKCLGYECRFKSENVSQYLSPLKIFGEIDFLHAFRNASLRMIEDAEEKEIFNGSLKIKVLKPEDIIGLKLQAIKNDPARKQREIEDIGFLISNYKKNMDFDLIYEYVRILEMDEVFREIMRRIEDENL